jgi:hypothetical protein
MKQWRHRPVDFLFLILTFTGCVSPIKPARTILLPGVNGSRPNVGIPGRVDHMAYDPATQRLFVAALENGSLEVVDCNAGQRAGSVTGLSRPQGIAIIDNSDCAAVGCGGDGRLHIFDTHTLQEKKNIEVGPDADNVRYDAALNRVLVCYGNTNGGGIASFDAGTWQKTGDIRFASKPESFQIDAAGNRLFANLPGGKSASHDGTVSVNKWPNGATIAEIPLKERARNFPMAFDAAHQRLFVACRRPAMLLEIDTRSYTVIAEAPCPEDSDDLFYDARRNRVLVIGGGLRPDMQNIAAGKSGPPQDETGAIEIYSVQGGGELRPMATMRTKPHARTGIFATPRRSIYLGVPPRDGCDAEILEYRIH